MPDTPTIVDVDLGDIDVTYIVPAPDNPRGDLGNIASLAASIKAVGVLQAVLVTRRDWADDDLCTSCVADAGTTADPDAPTTTQGVADAQAKADRKFVDDNQLQVGDVVNDDGTITRAADVDEISAAAPLYEDNAAESSNGKKRRTRATAPS